MCIRDSHYSVHNENSIDIVLFANGIPVVSMELKCQFTGQDTTNAINQYKFDRAGKDAIFAFKERVLVHFAVDLTNVYMTTRLEGAHTYFLPFNQGSNCLLYTSELEEKLARQCKLNAQLDLENAKAVDADLSLSHFLRFFV